MRYTLFIVFIILFLPTTYGQNQAQNGYIVLNQGDTLFGKIQRHKDTYFGIKHLNKIRFWNANGKRKKYRPSKLSGFKIGNAVYRKYYLDERLTNFNFLNNYYEIVPFGGEEIFLQVLKEGALSMYAYEWTEDNGNLESFPLFRRANESTMVRATQGIFGLKKKVLNSYFSDCSSLQEKLTSGFFKLPLDVVNYYNSNCSASN